MREKTDRTLRTAAMQAPEGATGPDLAPASPNSFGKTRHSWSPPTFYTAS